MYTLLGWAYVLVKWWLSKNYNMSQQNVNSRFCKDQYTTIFLVLLKFLKNNNFIKANFFNFASYPIFTITCKLSMLILFSVPVIFVVEKIPYLTVFAFWICTEKTSTVLYNMSDSS